MKNIQDYRIIFMGTPLIAAKVFSALIEKGFNFVALVAQEDKPVGRKGIFEPVPTKKVALEHNIPVYQPHRIRKDYEFIKDLKPDLILTMAYGQIVPQGLLDIPSYGCLNLHGSLLPKYRGAAPIQRAIIDGESKSGITLMEMIDKMDAGRIFAKEEIIIEDDDNYSSLCDKMSLAAINICEKHILNYLNGELPGAQQNEDEVTFANKISVEEEKLNLSLSTHDFINYVRGLSLTPGGYLFVNDKKLKILKAHQVSSSIGEVGKLTINKRVFLQLIDGVIELDYLQLEGKKAMDGKSFANGNKAFDGVILK